jgi:1-deoxy-D-xylulose-5-phosphate synthase
VAQFLLEQGLLDAGLRFRSMVLPDTFIDHASPEAMYRTAGLQAADIEAKALAALGISVVSRRA